MTEHYGVFLDGLIVVLLLATIFYAVALSRRLGALRDNRKEMESAVRRFAEASGKADASIKGLRRAADETGGSLQTLVDRAQTLRDEMAYLVDTAEALVERLEAQTGVPRPQTRRTAPAPVHDLHLDDPAPRDAPLTALRPGQRDAAPGPAGHSAPMPAQRDDRESRAHQDLLRAIENLR